MPIKHVALVTSRQGEAVLTVKQFIGGGLPENFNDCVKWARLEWESLFRNEILQILHTFPPDDAAAGRPFWVPPKRCPAALQFDVMKVANIQF
jgi:ubiquitin-activating enzyme E1